MIRQAGFRLTLSIVAILPTQVARSPAASPLSGRSLWISSGQIASMMSGESTARVSWPENTAKCGNLATFAEACNGEGVPPSVDWATTTDCGEYRLYIYSIKLQSRHNALLK